MSSEALARLLDCGPYLGSLQGAGTEHIQHSIHRWKRTALMKVSDYRSNAFFVACFVCYGLLSSRCQVACRDRTALIGEMVSQPFIGDIQISHCMFESRWRCFGKNRIQSSAHL